MAGDGRRWVWLVRLRPPHGGVAAELEWAAAAARGEAVSAEGVLDLQVLMMV